MSHTAARICEGEVLQFQMATLESYGFEGYQRVIEGKTAVLVATALEGVALLTGVGPDDRAALREAGMAYGRAFQMRDDYLDLLGDEAELGKPVGGDLREGKATYPILMLLEAGVPEVPELLRRHAGDPGDVPLAIDLVRRHGADVATRERIAAEVEAACEALARFPEGPARSAITALVRREEERVR
jgi:octaprenyl-diphosphate synthase